jgi:hypothetical protein
MQLSLFLLDTCSMLFLEQLNTQLSARSLGYAALTLYIAAVIVEVVRRLVSGKRRPPKVFMMVCGT